MANQEKLSSTSGPMMELNRTCQHAIQGSDFTVINPLETPRLLSLFSIITFHTILLLQFISFDWFKFNWSNNHLLPYHIFHVFTKEYRPRITKRSRTWRYFHWSFNSPKSQLTNKPKIYILRAICLEKSSSENSIFLWCHNVPLQAPSLVLYGMLNEE